MIGQRIAFYMCICGIVILAMTVIVLYYVSWAVVGLRPIDWRDRSRRLHRLEKLYLVFLVLLFVVSIATGIVFSAIGFKG
jgi:hypothetical protein